MPAPRPRRRDRHGRGLRGPLLPGSAPAALTRAEQFSDLVWDTVEHLDPSWREPLETIVIEIEDVPELGPGRDGLDPLLDPEVLEDQGVPLSRAVPGRGHGRRSLPPRLVVYRRPLEARAHDRHDLAHLVHDVVVEQLATLLGVPPEELDPGYDSGG